MWLFICPINFHLRLAGWRDVLIKVATELTLLSFWRKVGIFGDTTLQPWFSKELRFHPEAANKLCIFVYHAYVKTVCARYNTTLMGEKEHRVRSSICILSVSFDESELRRSKNTQKYTWPDILGSMPKR